MDRRILLVDDDPVVLLVYHDALCSLEGCEVATAKDAEEALAQVAREQFDLLVTDLSLPGMSGIELSERVRDMGMTTPIIWVTAYGCHNSAGRARALNVANCLDKPLEIDTLRQVVREALEAARS